jgi:hypothetical protein
MSYRAVAQRFGDSIANDEYGAAYALLAKDLKSTTTPQTIKDAVATMTSDTTGPILKADVIDDSILEDWPGKQAGDLAVVYVALNGDSFSEAVTLILATYGDEVLIRHFEWGRP